MKFLIFADRRADAERWARYWGLPRDRWRNVIDTPDIDGHRADSVVLVHLSRQVWMLAHLRLRVEILRHEGVTEMWPESDREYRPCSAS